MSSSQLAGALRFNDRSIVTHPPVALHVWHLSGSALHDWPQLHDWHQSQPLWFAPTFEVQIFWWKLAVGAWTVTVESVERGLWVTPCLFPSLPDSARLQQSVLWWTRLCLLRQDWRKCDGSDALNTRRPSCPKGSSLCFGDADWTHWGYCSATCGVGQVTRSQTLSRSLAVCSLSADTTSFAGMSSWDSFPETNPARLPR